MLAKLAADLHRGLLVGPVVKIQLILNSLRKGERLGCVVEVAILKQPGKALLARLLAAERTVDALTDVAVEEIAAEAPLDDGADKREFEPFLNDAVLDERLDRREQLGIHVADRRNALMHLQCHSAALLLGDLNLLGQRFI